MLDALKSAAENYVRRRGGGDGIVSTAIPGLSILKSETPTQPHHMVYNPSLCVVLQGAKQFLCGDATLDYVEGQGLVVCVEMPAVGKVTKASAGLPYMALSLELDRRILMELETEMRSASAPEENGITGAFVMEVEVPILNCLERLLLLSEDSAVIHALYPLIMREISFWLLTGPHGGEIRSIASPKGHARRIADAVRYIRENFADTLSVEHCASVANMSASSFHEHFKAHTLLSPVQYQKRLRLVEARRLITLGAENVSNAAYRVGYRSPSQFSREYLRTFGTTPRQDCRDHRAF